MKKLGIRNNKSEFYPLFSLGKKRKTSILLKNIYPFQKKGFIEFYVGENDNCLKNDYIGQVPFFCKNENFETCELDINYHPNKYLIIFIRESGNNAIKVIFTGKSFKFKNSKTIHWQLINFLKSFFTNIIFKYIIILFSIVILIYSSPFLINFLQYPQLNKKYFKMNDLKIRPLQSYIFNFFAIKKISNSIIKNDEFLSDVLLNKVFLSKQNFSAQIQPSNLLKNNHMQKVIKPFEPLYFVANQTVLIPGEKKKLEKYLISLHKYKPDLIKIIGHTANFGEETNKLTLSINRAKVIYEYFINSEKFDISIFEIIGKGSEEPIAPNYPEAEAEKNRRVEIHIILE